VWWKVRFHSNTGRYGPPVTRSVLAERDFRLILAAWGASMFGDFLAVIALTIRVQEASGSGLAVAALLVALGIPAGLFNPIAGWLVDRLETTRVLAVTAAAQAVVAVGLALVDSVAATVALAFVLGCGLAVESPALFSLLPRVVGEERAPRASGMLEAARYAGLTLGVLTGGILTGALGSGTAMLVDAGTFAVGAGAALALRTRRHPGAETAGEGATGMTAGLRTIGRDRVLRLSVLVLGSAVLFAGAVNVAEVFLVKGELDAGDAGYGALAASWGLGMTAGALGAGRLLTAGNSARTLVLMSMGTGVTLALTGAAPTLTVALALFLVGGACNGTENVAMRVLIQARVPDRIRGRVYSAYHGGMTVVEFLAYAGGGVLVQLVGARGTFGVAGVGALAAALVGAVVLARLRPRPRLPA
jgi:MFS family permease